MKIILLQQFSISDCWWWWLLASLVAFLLGLLLGYWLWYKYRARVTELEAEVKGLNSKLVDWEEKNKELQYQVEEVNKELTNLRNKLHLCEADKDVLKSKLDQAGAVLGVTDRGIGVDYGSLFPKDNLQIIEGIGAKIEQLLKDAGIRTWSELANTSVERLQEILDAAGTGFRLADPGTWAHQAKLASEGKWGELTAYQDFLDAGRDPSA